MCDNGKLQLKALNPTMKTPCTPVDPTNPDLERYPRFRYAKPITVTVREGEMLYLPGMVQYAGWITNDDYVLIAIFVYSILDAPSFAKRPGRCYCCQLLV